MLFDCFALLAYEFHDRSSAGDDMYEYALSCTYVVMYTAALTSCTPEVVDNAVTRYMYLIVFVHVYISS